SGAAARPAPLRGGGAAGSGGNRANAGPRLQHPGGVAAMSLLMQTPDSAGGASRARAGASWERERPEGPGQALRRVLFITYQFPPVGGAGVQRATKFVKYLPGHGWLPSVLTVANPS